MRNTEELRLSSLVLAKLHSWYGLDLHQLDFGSYACKNWANGTDTDTAHVKEHLWIATYSLTTENKDGEDRLATPLEDSPGCWSRSSYHMEARAGVQSLACLPERWPIRGLASNVLDSCQSPQSDMVLLSSWGKTKKGTGNKSKVLVNISGGWKWLFYGSSQNNGEWEKVVFSIEDIYLGEEKT